MKEGNSIAIENRSSSAGEAGNGGNGKDGDQVVNMGVKGPRNITHNLSYHDNGRIIIGWCPNAFDLSIMQVACQFIHCSITPKHGALFYCTYVYEIATVA